MKAIRIILSIAATYLYLVTLMFITVSTRRGDGTAAEAAVSGLFVMAFLMTVSSFYFRKHRGLCLLIPTILTLIAAWIHRTTLKVLLPRNDPLSVPAEFLLPAALLFLLWQWPIRTAGRRKEVESDAAKAGRQLKR